MVCLRQSFWVILIFLVVNAADAGNHYVSTDGKTTNDGTIDSPWPSVEYALSKVGGGNTIIVKPGVYGTFAIADAYKGTQAAPTIIRSETKWGAIITGSSTYGINTGTLCEWVVIDGFEIMGARIDGIKVCASYSVVRNCWVHNNVQQGIAIIGGAKSIIENNLIEVNGSHVQFHHGVYASGDGITIRNNIVRHNAGYGLHLYPSISHSSITNNLIYGHSLRPGLAVYNPVGGGHNIIANNTIADNNVGLTISNGDGEVVANNIFSNNISHTSFIDGTTNTIAPNNLLYDPITPKFGTDTIYAAPQFVDAIKGVYWLKTNSPAIGIGNALYLPATDFWGKVYPEEAKPYIGAFAYAEALTKDTFRSKWYNGWGYGYSPVGSQDGPDYWRSPDSK